MEENTKTPEEVSELKLVKSVEETPTEGKGNPVLLTEDRVEIFKGDVFYSVDLKTLEITEEKADFDVFAPDLIEVKGAMVPKHKFYSTREIAWAAVYIKVTIQEIEIDIPRSAMDGHLAQSIILFNVLGKSYWNEWKKLFKLPEPGMSKIRDIFE